ncbi:ATP-binding cassette domain-containing protein [Aurantiacibacter aquimixticola]|uniref:ABC transporter ATP-binding protein n=1 Tax=Aurantiacibacter aquimixticola TaxID=1958945 RepID=A0A419RQR9_9SPHN|nr:ABC transporter ATP-binding protein [Aurantiacibacter aquimixticola]RJY08129.1 ABC transporter ATP-binding protein [Aurantiacibacter aquimixticola]
MRQLMRAIGQYAGWTLLTTGAVVLAAALLEGVGLVLILPVVEVLFSDGTAQDGLTAKLVALLESWGFRSVTSQLALIGAGFLLLAILRALILMRRDVMMAELSQGFVDHIRRDFFALLARSDWPVIKTYRKSQLLNTMTINIGRLAMIVHALSMGAITLAMGLAYLVAAFVMDTMLGLAMLLLAAIGMVSAVLWTRRSHRLGRQLTRANTVAMDETTRFLDGLKAAKATRAEDELSARFAQSIAETRALDVQFVAQQARLRNAVQIAGAFGAMAVLLGGYGLLDLSGGELLVMAAIVLRLAPSLVGTFSNLQQMAHALPAFEAIRAVEDELVARMAVASGDGERIRASIATDAGLTLEEASVEVVNEDGARITLVSTPQIKIAPGMLVHVGGPSGAGKSSLVELAAGLHLPATGSLSRGGVELTADTRPAWQQQVSFAPQEPFLFDGTVRENLTWPNLDTTDAAIWDALEQAAAAELVRRLPTQLDEELLDGGARLSGGERQRLCIARALLRPASLLVLDEATSAMDPELERRIIGNLRESIGQRIILMVSHSLNAVGYADMRIEVADGRARLREERD